MPPQMPSREPPAVAPPLRASPGRARLLWLQLIASLVPFVALALVEAALRLAGYGDAYPLFVASADDARWLQPNPAVIERYFPPQLAPELAIAPNYFRRDKPADGIRIFVQGGSTAAGFPVEPAASLARLLRYRLGQSFPERPLEVVDTAMSAVTSVTLLDFADEIIAAEPDAVLIYAGHNEYLGIFGIGSAYRGASSRLATRLSFGIDELRLYQLLRNTWFEIRRRSSRPAASEATTLMAAIAAEQEIALDSADFRRGVSQWRRNLRALIERYTAAGIPVFVATVASNLSDQPPFISAPLADDVRAEAAARLAALSVVPLDADTAPPDPTPALARLEAIAAEQGSAELYFALGRAHERRGNDDDARRAFELAREHDLLPFRAPAAINAVVRELTRTTAARLVDVETVFVAAAPRGLVGDELMLEHLHPTVDGYFLLADAFYDALAAAATSAGPYRFMNQATQTVRSCG
jgi:lysophospholipase L1-like esterase